MKKNITLILLLLLTLTGYSQNDSIFNRLKAIRSNGLTFYNIDGINISYQNFRESFNEKNLKKIYRKYSIKKDDIKTKDEAITFQNFKIIKVDEISDNLKQINVYYFLENIDKETSVFWFGYIDSDNKNLEHQIIPLAINNQIPDACFASSKTDKIDFIGRKLELGGDCYWANINSIQCPYNGQMNWSIHKTQESADKSNQHQLNLTKAKKNGKVINEEEIEVLFEEVLTKAKKVTYDFNGVTSLVAGGENLTIYYVSEKIRNNYINCVLSFWNTDNITPNGLTPLLEEVMKIPEK
jgi:hypothetical protein